MENFCRKPFIHKAFWLCGIDLDVAFAIHEGIFAVDVQDVEIVGNCKSEDNSD
jgi:hypothetical protein